MLKGRPALLVDADVLIDYQKSNFSVMGLVNQHVGQILVLTTILSETDGLDTTDCERLGLKAVEPELNQTTRASRHRSRLSFNDHLCLVVALDQGFTCVTNDKALRKACNAEGVAILWGLEIMTALVLRGVLPAAEAIEIAERIHVSNPLHVSRQIVERFSRKVTAIEGSHGDR